MAVGLSRYRRIWRIHIAAGCALTVIGATAIAAAAAQPGGGGSAKDPLRLFAPMMPVFSHPRCSNCHGAVDVLAGVNHDQLEKSDVPLNDDGDMLSGQDGNAKCRECHDEDEQNSVWRLAPRSKTFAGKDVKSLCTELVDVNGLTDPARRADFLQHLTSDQLIGFAFEGRRGMVDNDQQQPPMDRPTFVNLARRWLDEGKARCSGVERHHDPDH